MIYIMRHAQSIANAGGVTTDPSSTPLTTFGKDQALDVGFDFGTVDLIISSHYLRAQETAGIMSTALDVATETWDGIQEWTLLDPKRYAGTTHAQRESEIERLILQGDPDYVDGPQAESFNHLLGRVDHFVQRCIELPDDKTTVVVSHEWFLKALLWSFAIQYRPVKGPDLKSFWSFTRAFHIDNCQWFKLNF